MAHILQPMHTSARAAAGGNPIKLLKDLFRTQGRADSALLAELCVDLDEKLSFHGHPSIQIVPLEDS